MQDGLFVVAGGAEAAGFKVVLVTVQPNLSGLRLLRLDLLVGGGVGGLSASGLLDGAVLAAVGLCVSVSESDSTIGGVATSTGGAGGDGDSGSDMMWVEVSDPEGTGMVGDNV